ncbi:MAG: hypothetical protein ACI9NT_002327 [Bacteroidia bacterium]
MVKGEAFVIVLIYWRSSKVILRFFTGLTSVKRYLFGASTMGAAGTSPCLMIKLHALSDGKCLSLPAAARQRADQYWA